MTATRLTLLLLLTIATVSVAKQSGVYSVYTSLVSEDCRLKSRLTGSHPSGERECPGIAKYKLLVLEDDERFTVSVISPNKVVHPLDTWRIITGRFSYPGEKAEWRLLNKNGVTRPVALIFRVYAHEKKLPGNKTGFLSYLAVVNIGKSRICITAKISPGPDQNREARIAADKSATRPCLRPLR